MLFLSLRLYIKYYNPEWDADEYQGTKDTSHVRAALEKAVLDQTMSDVPIGLLLSGGLDSAVVVSRRCKLTVFV